MAGQSLGLCKTMYQRNAARLQRAPKEELGSRVWVGSKFGLNPTFRCDGPGIATVDDVNV